MGDFQKLLVWQKAKDLSVSVYRITNEKSFAHDFDLRNQMRRSAVSIASNIAEGEESGYNAQAVRFLKIAKGSAAELRTQIVISYEVGYLANDEYKKLYDSSESISKMLYRLIQSKS